MLHLVMEVLLELEVSAYWRYHGLQYNEFNRAPVAQLVEHRAVLREVVSSTPAGPTLRVLK